jgi:hypothetical protein
MFKLKRFAPMVGLIVLLLLCTSGRNGPADEPGASADPALSLERSVLSSGGSPAAASAWHLNGTLGQPTSSEVEPDGDGLLHAGFWARPPHEASGYAVMRAQAFGEYASRNFPNPFSLSTTIDYTLSRECDVSIAVFDIHGRKVKTLLTEVQGPGRYRVTWGGLDDGGREVSPGIYLCRLDRDSQRTVRKMVLAR